MDFANDLGLGGSMVWAMDLDPTRQSVDNLFFQALRNINDDVDSNPVQARLKLHAIQAQNNVNLLTLWTDCSSSPSCPPGFDFLTMGVGKVGSNARNTSFC